MILKYIVVIVVDDGNDDEDINKSTVEPSGFLLWHVHPVLSPNVVSLMNIDHSQLWNYVITL